MLRRPVEPKKKVIADTSIRAYVGHIKPNLTRYHKWVLDAIVDRSDRDTWTCREIHRVLQEEIWEDEPEKVLPTSSISGRVNELVKMGILMYVGKRVCKESKKKVKVYQINMFEYHKWKEIIEVGQSLFSSGEVM